MYAQILLALSFALGSYQDIKERMVSDLVWIPAAAGVAIILYDAFTWSNTFFLQTEVLKLALAGFLVVVLYYLGIVGQADLIALVFFFSDPYPWSFFFAMLGVAAVMGGHMLTRALRRQPIFKATMPVDQFMREPHWVPSAVIFDGKREAIGRDVNFAREEVQSKRKEGMLVEAKYGTPTLAYYGIGYICYLVLLALLSYPVFAALP